MRDDGRISRREWLKRTTAAAGIAWGGRAAAGLASTFDLRAIERSRIVPAADRILAEAPITITAFRSPRSAGGPHDFFSEADYWWPDPINPGGPYVQRDGLSNPANFVEHRRAMIRFATSVATLTSAYRLTGDERYATQARRHLRAWFVDEATKMAPHLRYAQAIQGRVTGRGTGIIDTIHLVEVARSASVLEASPSASPGDAAAIRDWFADYLRWLTTHEYGIAERDARNNHATCWVMQVAVFAGLTGDRTLLDFCRERYTRVLVPDQMAVDGSFPLELKRTKPYGYSLFNLDALATICWVLSPRPTITGRPEASALRSSDTGQRKASALRSGDTGQREALALPGTDDLWTWTTPDGRGIRRAVQFLHPYLRDKSSWRFGRDVMYFDEWPVRQPSLLFAGLALGEPRYLQLWSSLKPDPAVEEVVRNLPVRHPIVWMD